MTAVGQSSSVGRPVRADHGDAPKATLVFFYSPRSGLSRRMDGVVSWLFVRERKRLRLRMVNVDVRQDLADRFEIAAVPTLLLVVGQRVVSRVEGRVTGRQLDHAVLPYLPS